MNKNLTYYFTQPLNNKKFHHDIYQLSATQLYGMILRILRQDQLAQDCLQKVFVKIYRKSIILCITIEHQKTRQIVDYFSYFWVKNVLFSAFPESHWGF